MRGAHAALKPGVETISGARAAELLSASMTGDISVIGFDETEASRLGVKLHEVVSVTPDDHGTPDMHVCSLAMLTGPAGKVPTTGKLLALNKEEVVIETHGTAGTFRCHFPRLYYVIKSEVAPKL